MNTGPIHKVACGYRIYWCTDVCMVLQEGEASGSATFNVVVSKGCIAKLFIQWAITSLDCCASLYYCI